MERHMNHAAVTLSPAERNTVLDAIVEICQLQDWKLFGAHVRSNHVHVVVATSSTSPERVMLRLKTQASQRLSEAFGSRMRRWTRHGSTRYLRNEVSVHAAIRYVVEGQGTPMAVYHLLNRPTPDPEPRMK